MGKYLALWQIDQSKIPIDRKERGAGWAMLMAMVKQDIEKKVITEWGSFVGETNGYAIFEGAELEVMTAIQQYVPFCIFKVHPVATESQTNDMIRALSA